ncbi:transposase [Candidatus Magnetomorum sp. HK-1]|nr:transposase [Candidatus Magnetomorum sp. HK-1]
MKPPTKFVSDLTKDEIAELYDFKQNGNCDRVRTRAHAIILSARGYSIDEIADIFQVKRDTVSSWIDNWESNGIKGLFDKVRNGAPTKINAQELETIKKIIEETPNSPKTILGKIKEILNKTISISTLKRIIKKLRKRWKRVRGSLRQKRQQDEFDKAQQEIIELKQSEEKGLLDVVYFDESGFSLAPSIPYAYQDIGETIEIQMSKSKRLNVLGFLNTNKNKLESFCFECSIDSEIVVTCFNEYCTILENKTIVILDNARVHTSDEFQENIGKWEKQGLFIKFLPKYSPELNKIEILWRIIKYNWLPLTSYISYSNLVNAVELILSNYGNEFVINFT